jgi:hypothetical protein
VRVRVLPRALCNGDSAHHCCHRAASYSAGSNLNKPILNSFAAAGARGIWCLSAPLFLDLFEAQAGVQLVIPTDLCP